MSLRNTSGLFFWLGLSFCAALTGAFIHPGAWHAALAKPAWNPPNWLFAPVWTALYTLMAIAAWRVWKTYGFKGASKALGFFLLQLALNALWTPFFFGLHEMGWALVDLVCLNLALAATIIAFSKKDRLAAGLLIPYILWTLFAGFLNFTIWRLNS